MDSPRQYTRRDALTLLGATGTAGALGATTDIVGAGRRETREAGGLRLDDQPADSLVDKAVERNDIAVRALLPAQITDPSSAWRGSVPDQYGLHSAGSAGGVTETLAASFVHPRSRFHDDPALLERIRLAAGFLERSLSPQGNIDLLSTNFNSPPVHRAQHPHL